MQISMTEQEKEQLVKIRSLATELAANSHNRVNALAALIMELAKSHQYCDARYIQEKLNWIFYEEQVKWHTENMSES